MTVWVASHRATVQKVVDALVATMHWISTHSAADIANAMPAAYVSNGITTRAAYIAELAADKGQFLPDGMMPSSGPATVLAIEKFVGNVTGPINMAATYTNAYAIAAKQARRLHQLTPFAQACPGRHAMGQPGQAGCALPREPGAGLGRTLLLHPAAARRPHHRSPPVSTTGTARSGSGSSPDPRAKGGAPPVPDMEVRRIAGCGAGGGLATKTRAERGYHGTAVSQIAASPGIRTPW